MVGSVFAVGVRGGWGYSCSRDSRFSRASRNSRITRGKRFVFVKIICKKNANFDLALRKRLFCNAKPTLLPCKTAAFGTQNNRFCKALINKQLHNSYACEKYLHYS